MALATTWRGESQPAHHLQTRLEESHLTNSQSAYLGAWVHGGVTGHSSSYSRWEMTTTLGGK